MKQFKTVLKVKKFEETQILENINNVNIEIDSLQNNINSIEKNIKNAINNADSTDSNDERRALTSIIENLKESWKSEEHKKYLALQRKNSLSQELILKKQEIKSIEMIIEKKEYEAKLVELKKEQDALDELNIADY